MTNYYNKSEIVSLLQAKAKELNRNPMPKDLDEQTAKGILNYFKKWEKALKAAGLIKATYQVAKKADLPKKAVKACAKKVIEKKVKEQIVETAAKTECAAGGNKRYTKEIITALLLAEYKRLGKKPTKKEIDANENLPSASTCLKHFNTTRLGDMWAEILGE